MSNPYPPCARCHGQDGNCSNCHELEIQRLAMGYAEPEDYLDTSYEELPPAPEVQPLD